MKDPIVFSSNVIRNQALEIRNFEQVERLREELEGLRQADVPDGGPVADYRQHLFDSQQKIAPFKNTSVNSFNLMSNRVTNITSETQFDKRSIYRDNSVAVKNLYSSLFNNLIPSFQTKTATAQDHLLKTINFTHTLAYGFNERVKNTASTFKETENAFNKLTAGKTPVITFDIETFGGKNDFGKQDLDMITEFAFLEYDEFSKDSLASGPSNKRVGFVGIQQSNKQQYEDLVQKFVNDPTSLTSKDQVILNYLAKLGDERMDIKEGAKPGQYIVANSPGMEDIVVNEQSIRKGMDRSLRIGRVQAATATNGLMQWERDLAEGIQMMQDKNKNATVLGHNIIRADIPWLNQFMAGASPGFRDYIQQIGGQTSIDISKKRTADTLSLVTHGLTDDTFSNKFLDRHMREVLNDNPHLTPASLEAISKRFGTGNMGNLASHTAEFDSIEVMRMLLNGQIGKEKKGFIPAALEAGRKSNVGSIGGQILGNNKQYFMATSALGQFGMDSMLGFRYDDMTETIGTTDGYTIGKDGSVVKNKNNIREFVTRKNMVYTIDEIKSLKAGEGQYDEYIKKMKQVNPALAVEDLAMVKFSPVTMHNGVPVNLEAGGAAEKLKMSSYVIGTKESLQQMINSSFGKIAEMDGNGVMQEVPGAREKFGRVEIDPETKAVKPVQVDDFVGDAIKSGVAHSIQEDAGRKVRDMSIDHFERTLLLAEEVDRIAGKAPVDMPAEEAQAFVNRNKRAALEAMFEESKEVARRVAKGEVIPQDSSILEGTFHKILGLERDIYGTVNEMFNLDERTKQSSHRVAQGFHPRMVDNMLATLNYAESMSDVMKTIIQDIRAVDPKTGFKDGKHAAMFRSAMEIVQGQIQAVMGDSYATQATMRNFNMGYFEMDMTSLTKQGRGLPLGTVLGLPEQQKSLKIGFGQNAEYDLIKQLQSGRNVKGEPTFIKKQLGQLMDLAGIRKEVAGKNVSDYMSRNSHIVIARDIISTLRGNLQQGDGLLNIPQMHDVVNTGDIKTILNDPKFDRKNVMARVTDSIKGFEPSKFFNVSNALNNSTSRNTLVNNIVENFMMDKINSDSFKNLGYSEEATKYLMSAREVRQNEYKALVNNMLEGLSGMNAQLRMDEGTGSISMIKDGKSYDISSYLPRERFQDGHLFTQVGRSKYAIGMGIGVDGKGTVNADNVKLQSGVGRAMDGVEWTLKDAVIRKQQKGEDPIETFTAYFRKIAEGVRTGSSVDGLSEKDARTLGHLNVSQVFDNLHRIDGIEGLKLGGNDEISVEETRKLQAQIARGEKFSYGRANDTIRSIIAKHEDKILDFVFNATNAKPEVANVLNLLGGRQKGKVSSEGVVNLVMGSFELERFNAPTRAFEGSADYLSYREDVAQERLKRLGLDDSVYTGAQLRTNLGYAYSSGERFGIDGKVQTETTVKRAYMSGSQFNTAVREAADKEKKAATKLGNDLEALRLDDVSDRIRTVAQIYEGSAVADSRLGDAILQNYDRQRASAARQFFDTHDLNLDQIKETQSMSEVVPEFRIGDDGKIEFTYSKGAYKTKNSLMLEEFNTFGGDTASVYAKYDGALKMGFFTSSGLARESEVKQNVYKYASENGIKITDQDGFLQIANKLYRNDFYLDRVEEATYRKVHEDRVEKGMTRFMYSGLGESSHPEQNSKINKLLGNLGLTNLKGKVLRADLFEELTDGDWETSFIRKMSTANLTNDDFMKAITDAGFDSRDTMAKALTAERHELSDFLRNNFNGAVYFSQTGDTKHANVSRPINDAVANMWKQEFDALAPSSMTLEEKRRRASHTVAAVLNSRNVFQGVDGKGLTVNKAGDLVMPEMDFNEDSKINLKELKAAYDGKYGKFEDIMNPGSTNFTAISVTNDYTGTTGSGAINEDTDLGTRANSKGFKIGAREMNWMGSRTIDQESVDLLKQKLTPEQFKGAVGHMIDAEGNLTEGYAGKSYFEPFMNKIRKDIYAQNGDTDLIMDHKGQLGEDVKLSPLEAKMANALHSEYGGSVSRNALNSAIEIDSNLMAMDFNAGNRTVEDLKASSHGFQVKKLSELDFASGGDAAYMTGRATAPNSIYNQATVIDLSEIDEKVRIAAGMDSPYLAVGNINSAKMGSELMSVEPQKILGNINSAMEQLRYENANGLSTPSSIASIQGRIADNLQEFRGSLSAYTTGKSSALKTELSEIRVEKAATGKAGLMPLLDIGPGGSDVVKALETAKVDGMSIIDHHRDGRLMDFRLASESHMRAMGLFDEDYLRNVYNDRTGALESLEEKMRKQLREGVQIIGERNPVIYEGSMKPMTLIMSDALKDTQVIDYAAGAVSAKADADGDQIKSVLTAVKDEHGRNIDYIQAQNRSTSKFVDDQFATIKARQYYNATHTNLYYKQAVEEDMASIKRLEGDYAPSSELANSRTYTQGIIRPELATRADEITETNHYNKYKEVENIAINKMFAEQGVDPAVADYTKASVELREMGDYEKRMKSALHEISPESINGDTDYNRALDYVRRKDSMLAGRIGANKQAAAGQINLPLFKVRRIREIAGMDTSAAKNSQLDHILEAAEEAFLTPKHAEGKIINNTMVIDEFNRAMQAAAGNPMRGDEAGAGLLTDWFEKNLPGRYKPDKLRELGQIANPIDSLSKAEQRAAFADSAQEIVNIFSQKTNIDRLNLSMNIVGQVSTGVNDEQLRNAMIYTPDSKELSTSAIRAIDIGGESRIGQSVELLDYKDVYGGKDGPVHEWEPPKQTKFIGETRNVMADVQEAMSKRGIKGKHLAFGALGIAGATMLAGYVGGNPSEASATTAAAGAAQDQYQVPMLTDDVAASMQATPNQGYVININAASPKGMHHAQEAVKQAMQMNAGATNVNVAMNINNNPGNITDSTIERMINNYVGF